MTDQQVPTVIMVPVNDLTPNPDNPRVNSSGISVTAESIRKFGFKVPIVIDGEKNILAGHTRYRAAISLGLDKVPCIDASDLTPEEQAAFSVAENRTSDFSFFDAGKLADVMVAIPEDLLAGFDLDAIVTPPEEESGPATTSKTPEKRPGLDLAPFEQYTYVMIMCRTEFDYVNLLELLELQNVQKRYVDGTLKQGSSYGRVIEFPEFMERVRAR